MAALNPGKGTVEMKSMGNQDTKYLFVSIERVKIKAGSGRRNTHTDAPFANQLPIRHEVPGLVLVSGAEVAQNVETEHAVDVVIEIYPERIDVRRIAEDIAIFLITVLAHIIDEAEAERHNDDRSQCENADVEIPTKFVAVHGIDDSTPKQIERGFKSLRCRSWLRSLCRVIVVRDLATLISWPGRVARRGATRLLAGTGEDGPFARLHVAEDLRARATRAML